MNYLANSIKNNQEKIKSYEVSEKTKKELLENFQIPTLNQDLTQWYIDLPQDENITFFWTNDFDIIASNNLNVALEGFRYIKNNANWEDLVEMQWQRNWIIISTINGNPIIADIAKPKTPIYYDYVGGDFSPQLLVDSLEKFDYFLGVWLSKHNDEYYHNGKYKSEYYDSLENEWKVKLTEQEIQNIKEFLPIAKANKTFNSLPKFDNFKKKYIYLDDVGKNRSKVIVAIKKETGLSFNEIIKELENTPFFLTEGYGDNKKELINYLTFLDAKIRVEEI
ncbi:hypothetical protein [Flavobacterium tyrosinilyticum]|uniref:hypothetical protein n=1 Tax=Flavobacterium tyrosinilyticum TaxID=1658740 RepID=UPI0020308AB8|nr:hypothetical protein [Flavobacterium tyrosinilyticum]MCM0665563.1 hypothetical protein [Flavobacterium tyrosinilyticum]